ncbi:MAG: TIGR03618 family F420-dependent PPOX class oxidoreductase [Chromatiales bacterium]|nr:TIGR03618 family F420-dependent PPOX class oxidoreductase [Chromatiales bacterium]
MNISERAHEFLSRTQVCVLATTGPGNSPHAVPMWYRYLDGIITISTWRGSQKSRNVERTGKATVVVDRRHPPYYAVMVKGDAEIGPALSRDEEREMAFRYVRSDGVDEFMAYVDESDASGKSGATIVIRPTRVIEYPGD